MVVNSNLVFFIIFFFHYSGCIVFALKIIFPADFVALLNQLVDAIASNARTVFGAIYEKEGHLLLRDDGQNGDVSVPEFGRDGKGNQLGKLAKTLEGQPLYGEIDFVYAVFEDHRTHSVTVYYRGHATGEAPDGYRFYSFAEMPWDRITDQPVKTMIERYIAEAEANEFAIYMGDETEGVVKTLS